MLDPDWAKNRQSGPEIGTLNDLECSGKPFRMSAEGGNRTRTPVARPRILSPVRLPVPPPRHKDSLQFSLSDQECHPEVKVCYNRPTSNARAQRRKGGRYG